MHVISFLLTGNSSQSNWCKLLDSAPHILPCSIQTHAKPHSGYLDRARTSFTANGSFERGKQNAFHSSIAVQRFQNLGSLWYMCWQAADDSLRLLLRQLCFAARKCDRAPAGVCFACVLLLKPKGCSIWGSLTCAIQRPRSRHLLTSSGDYSQPLHHAAQDCTNIYCITCVSTNTWATNIFTAFWPAADNH